MRTFVSSRCFSATRTADSRMSTSRRAATAVQYARSTPAVTSLAMRRSDESARVRSTRAMRMARRAGSVRRFCSSGWRTSAPREVDQDGVSSAKILFVSSRLTPETAKLWRRSEAAA
jgi:hypothetical protein